MPRGQHLRILLRQNREETSYRLSGGAPPDGQGLDQLIRITAHQADRLLPLRTQCGKAIWSGLSWASAEIDARNLDPTMPVRICGHSTAPEPVELQLECYGVHP